MGNIYVGGTNKYGQPIKYTIPEYSDHGRNENDSVQPSKYLHVRVERPRPGVYSRGPDWGGASFFWPWWWFW